MARILVGNDYLITSAFRLSVVLPKLAVFRSSSNLFET